MSGHLNGSSFKSLKCLELLQVIVTSNRLVVTLDKSTVQRLALELYHLCSEPDLSDKSLMCLLEIFKRNHELVLPASTSLFIEMTCSLQVKPNWPHFLSFVINFLKIVRFLKVKKPILHFGVLLNYLNRLPILPKAKVSWNDMLLILIILILKLNKTLKNLFEQV